MSASMFAMPEDAPHEVRPSTAWLGLLGLILCLFGTLQIARWFTTQDRMLRDFVQEWTSARNWQVGRPIYQDLRESIPFHLPKARAGALHFNAHPPAAVLIALPFGTFGYAQGLRAWNLAALLSVAIAIAGLVGHYGYRLTRSERLLVFGLVLSSSVLEAQILHGQLNGLLLLVLTGAWLAERHDRPFLAGMCVGTATALKLFPGLLVLFFVARRQWAAVIAAATTFVLLNGIAAGVLGIDAMRDYLLVVMPQANRFCDTWPNASLLGFLTRLFDGSFGQTTPIRHWPALARVLWICLSAAGVALTWKATTHNRSPESQNLIFSAWMTLMLLISPITWDHYFLFAVLPLMALWKQSHIAVPSPKLFLICATLLLVILSPYKVWMFLIPGYSRFGMSPVVATPTNLLTVVSFQFYVTVGLFVFNLSRSGVEWRTRRAVKGT